MTKLTQLRYDSLTVRSLFTVQHFTNKVVIVYVRVWKLLLKVERNVHIWIKDMGWIAGKGIL
jgi:hypothetical protein